MDSSDIFLYLFVRDRINGAGSAFKLPHNKKWFHTGRHYSVAEESTIGSRENTPAFAPDVGPLEEAEDRLVVTFSGLFNETEDQGPIVKDGVKFGTRWRDCQVLLGHRGTPYVSATHFSICVDDKMRLWLHDQSRCGTAVETDGKNAKEIRTNSAWLLARAAGSRPMFEDITIHLQGRLAMGVVFPNHNKSNPKYQQNLRRLFNKCKAAEQSKNEIANVEDLVLASDPTTTVPSGVTTPSTKDVYYDRGVIGYGSFGVVRKIIQARTGRAFAQKQLREEILVKKDVSKENDTKKEGPCTGDKRSRQDIDGSTAEKYKQKLIKKLQGEFEFVAQSPHRNVMKVFQFQEDPPLIIMDYYEMGNLAQAGDMNADMYMTAFGQVLSGLEHLHKNGIVHRDLKPANILLESWAPLTVVIADFGLAKTIPDNALLRTTCGTMQYAAPEIFSKSGHGLAVDIWSLGVMVLEWIYRLPKLPSIDFGKAFSKTWTDRLLIKLSGVEDCPLTDLLACMIEPDPSERWSATTCLADGRNKNLFQQRKDGMIVCKNGLDDVAVLGDSSTSTILPEGPSRSASTIRLASEELRMLFEASPEAKDSHSSRHTSIKSEDIRRYLSATPSAPPADNSKVPPRHRGPRSGVRRSLRLRALSGASEKTAKPVTS